MNRAAVDRINSDVTVTARVYIHIHVRSFIPRWTSRATDDSVHHGQSLLVYKKVVLLELALSHNYS